MEKKLKYFSFRPDFYFETATDFCLHLGISIEDIANLTGYHPKTAQKWINNDTAPVWLLPFLYAVYGGVISCSSFYGWNLNDGMVNAPGIRYGLTCSQIETYCWHLDTLKQSQATVRYLEQCQAQKTAVKNTAVIIQFPGKN